MTLTHDWRIAIGLGATVSLILTVALYLTMSPVAQRPGLLGSVSRFAAMPGFLGFVSGMIAAGNGHVGGPLAIVLTVATIVNLALYSVIAYALIRIFRMATGGQPANRSI